MDRKALIPAFSPAGEGARRVESLGGIRMIGGYKRVFKMSMKDKIKEKRGLIAIIFCGMVVLLFCYFIYFITMSWSIGEWRFEANWFDSVDTAAAFTYSLAYNRTTTMKIFVDERYWPFLDSWSTIHKQVSDQCQVPDDPDLEAPAFSGSTSPSGIARVDFFFIYECPSLYSLSSITHLKKIDGRWKIIEWENLCENDGSSEVCFPNSSSLTIIE